MCLITLLSDDVTVSLTQEPDAPIAEAPSSMRLDLPTRRKLRSLCWETMFGQEIVKLTVGDLVMTILSTIIIDFLRALFVRFMNKCWCWDLEKKFPQYGDFKIAENILHLINNQGMVWMGIFFSPGLPLINVIKLIIIMYLRAWAVLTCNVPHEIVFRASRSNNFFFALLLLMLFLCVLPVGYAIVWVEPSWHCGPFSHYKRIYHILTHTLKKTLPRKLHRVMDYVASPGIVIPLLMLLVLVIYYLLSLTSALREANNDLKIQLRRERTEERRKMFQIADRRRRGIDDFVDSTLVKWKQILPEIQGDKMVTDEINISNSSQLQKPGVAKRAIKLKRKGTMADIVQKAISNKNAGVPENQTDRNPVDENADSTDVEEQESLSEDFTAKLKRNDVTNQDETTETEKRKEKRKDRKGKREERKKRSRQKSKPESLDASNIPTIHISETSSVDSKKHGENSCGGSAETIVQPKSQIGEELSDNLSEIVSDIKQGNASIKVSNVKRDVVERAEEEEEEARSFSDPPPATISVENELIGGTAGQGSTNIESSNSGKRTINFKSLFRKHKTTPVSDDRVEKTWTGKTGESARAGVDATRSLSLNQPKKKKNSKNGEKTTAASDSDLSKEKP